MNIVSISLDAKIGYYRMISAIVQSSKKHAIEPMCNECRKPIEQIPTGMKYNSHNLCQCKNTRLDVGAASA